MENGNNVEALTTILNVLKDLDVDAQKRTLQAVSTFLGISYESNHMRRIESNNSRSDVPFSENRAISPKEFLRDKSPHTDIERVACLAYYLTHYRDLPHFKTLDISALNTEAAQPKFSNSALAVNNAATAGILVQATKGSKQISGPGELFVQALPDRDAARASIANIRSKKRSKKSTPKNLNNTK